MCRLVRWCLGLCLGGLVSCLVAPAAGAQTPPAATLQSPVGRVVVYATPDYVGQMQPVTVWGVVYSGSGGSGTVWAGVTVELSASAGLLPAQVVTAQDGLFTASYEPPAALSGGSDPESVTLTATVEQTDWSATLSATATLAVYALQPQVTQVSPASAAPGTTVSIGGYGFQAAPPPLPSGVTLPASQGATAVTAIPLQVFFGAMPASGVQVDGPTGLSATVPQGSGTVDVTVVTPDGTSAVSAADRFSFIQPPAPLLSGVAPDPAPAGATVTLTGSQLDETTAVLFGDSPAAFEVESDTQISATVPPGSGTVPVSVQTPAGAASATTGFSYAAVCLAQGLHVCSVAPDSGPLAGGTPVTIAGAGFDQVQAVMFGPAAATDVLVVSPTQITADSPPGMAAGAVQVVVQAAVGTSPATDDVWFEYLGDGPATVSTDPAGPVVPGAVPAALPAGFEAVGEPVSLPGSGEVTLVWSTAGVPSGAQPVLFVQAGGGWQELATGEATGAFSPQALARVALPAEAVLAYDEGGFDDVPKGYWAAGQIAAAAGFMHGLTPDGAFDPAAVLTRADWAYMLDGLIGARATGPAGFSDVSPQDWFAGAVAALTQAGITDGVAAGRFAPDEPVSREQAAVWAGRVLHLTPSTQAPRFTDAKRIAGWAAGWVAACAADGLISGFPDGTFRPNEALTRAQGAALLVRIERKLAPQAP